MPKSNRGLRSPSMKIIVAYPSLNSLGGAERLCMHVIKALRKRKYNVTLATLDKTNWVLLRKVFDESFRPDGEFYLLSRIPEIPTLTLRQAFVALSYTLELFLITLKGEYDLLVNMGGEIMDSIGDVIYINAIPLKLMHIYPQIQPTHNVQWRCYSRLYSLLTSVLGNHSKVIVTNSMFNKDIVRRNLGRKALVVHPPVDIQKIKSLMKYQNRENIVVTVSRFRSAKGLEIIPKIARHVQNCKFSIIGTADMNSEECLKEISERTKKLGVQARIRIFVNIPFNNVLEKLFTAKVFLHTQPTEAFGISIVEAMAAGCVPVVPRDGGPWFDILNQDQGKYGYAYSSPREAAHQINLLMNDERLRTEISRRASERANRFTGSVFERKIVNVIHEVAVAKLK